MKEEKRKWRNILCVFGFCIQRKWLDRLYWSGDFSGHAFYDGGYVYRIKKQYCEEAL